MCGGRMPPIRFNTFETKPSTKRERVGFDVSDSLACALCWYERESGDVKLENGALTNVANQTGQTTFSYAAVFSHALSTSLRR
jgi:hypothetical protein